MITVRRVRTPEATNQGGRIQAKTDAEELEARPPDGRSGWARRAGTAARWQLRKVGQWVESNRSRRPLIDVVLRLHERDQEAAGAIAGSAVAFRLFLFFVPTLLVVVAVAGFLAAHVSADDVASAAGGPRKTKDPNPQ